MDEMNDGEAAVERVSAEIEGRPPLTMQGEAPLVEVYRLDPKSKVPVSRHEGPVWEARKKSGSKSIEHLRTGWEEAEYYYDNAQQNHRKETEGNKSGTRNVAKDRRDSFSMTENIVYATVNAIVPTIYAKNPNVEITMTDQAKEPLGTMLEHLANKIAGLRYAPGIHLKPKIKKNIVRTEITNESWMLVGWNLKEFSADQAREDIARLGNELVKAKDAKEIQRLEGELMALEETIDLLDPAGPFVKTLRGDQVLVDPASTEDDFSDAQWIMVQQYMPTAYLNARYRVKGKNGEYLNSYQPTHVVDAAQSSNAEALQQELDNFKIFDGGKDARAYGYDDSRTFDRAKRTLVWLCFDKVKRRFYMYDDKMWTWPIWVFEDPYGLPNFFPLHPLKYHASPRSNRSRGEVSHYLDQQDEINTIVDELNRARVILRDKTIYNSNLMTPKDAEDLILNPNKKLIGVKWPEGVPLDKVIGAPPLPNLQFEHLWSKDSAKAAVNMISGVGEAQRGEQFKTNTTNQAIQEYSSITGVRLDEKRDAIEDHVGAIMYDVIFLCLRFMDRETVESLVGSQYGEIASQWQNLDPKTIRTLLVCTVEGGSTQKPTSAAKKAEALQVGQILGQFASASPYVVIILLKVFQRAFDGIVMTDTDWDQLSQSIQMQLMQGSSAGPQQQGNGSGDEAIVADMVKQGIPKEEAIRRLEEEKRKQRN